MGNTDETRHKAVRRHNTAHAAVIVLPTMWSFLGEVLEGVELNTGSTVNPPSGSGAGVPGPQGPPGPPGADGSNWQTYSTEEQAVGTWIDGRTLYRKCYAELTSPATEGQKNDFLYVKDLGIKTLVRCNAAVGRFSTPISTTGASAYIWITESKDYLAIKVSGSSTAGKPTTVILEYTKTTD